MPPKVNGFCLKNNEKIWGYFSNFYSYILIIYRYFLFINGLTLFSIKKIIPFVFSTDPFCQEE